MVGRKILLCFLALFFCYVLDTVVHDQWFGQEHTKLEDDRLHASSEATISLDDNYSASKQLQNPTKDQARPTNNSLQHIHKHLRADIVPDISLIPDRQSKRVNCWKLINDTDTNSQYFQDAMHINQSLSLNPEDIIAHTKNCDHFIKARGYIMDSMTQEEKDFPIAYSLVMYTAPGQAERLLRAIYRPQNFYCIHIDVKASNSTKDSMQAIADCFENVFVVANPTSVYWGEFGVLECEFICMRSLVKFKWKYFINLTGHEFPLVSNYKIVKALQVYNGSNEISNEHFGNLIKQRWKTEHHHGQTQSGPLRKDPPPANITLFKGSAHVVLNRRFVEYLLEDPFAEQFLNWTKLVSCPEEIFFPSLQYNTHLKAPGAFKDHNGEYEDLVSRQKVWKRERTRKQCASMKFRHFICIFGVGDLKYLRNDKHAFFINKLIDDFQPVTLDCLEELHANRTRKEYEGKKEIDLTFYKQLPFVHNHN